MEAVVAALHGRFLLQTTEKDCDLERKFNVRHLSRQKYLGHGSCLVKNSKLLIRRSN